MAISVAQIDLWRSVKSETQNLEFKEAKNQYDNDKLFKYCVAFANEGGGLLFFSITDKLRRLRKTIYHYTRYKADIPYWLNFMTGFISAQPWPPNKKRHKALIILKTLISLQTMVTKNKLPSPLLGLLKAGK